VSPRAAISPPWRRPLAAVPQRAAIAPEGPTRWSSCHPPSMSAPTVISSACCASARRSRRIHRSSTSVRACRR
jgi:hypothetical protein